MTSWRSSPNKRQYTRAHYEIDEDQNAFVTPTSGPGSHLIAGLSRANALVIGPEQWEEIPDRTSVEVMLLDSQGGSHDG